MSPYVFYLVFTKIRSHIVKNRWIPLTPCLPSFKYWAMASLDEVKKTKPQLIAAIDIGNYRSGYGWSTIPFSSIGFQFRWQYEVRDVPKTRSSILLEKVSGKFNCVAFGREAFLKFMKMDSKESEKYYFFDRYKTCLYGSITKLPMINVFRESLSVALLLVTL